MRRSLLASVLEIVERNIRLSDHLALFEIGPVFIPHAGQDLPDEPRHLVIALSGLRHIPAWDVPDKAEPGFLRPEGYPGSILERLHVLERDLCDRPTIAPSTPANPPWCAAAKPCWACSASCTRWSKSITTSARRRCWRLTSTWKRCRRWPCPITIPPRCRPSRPCWKTSP